MSHWCLFGVEKVGKLQGLKSLQENAMEYALGKIYTLSTELENCVNCVVNVNLDTCKLICHLNGTVYLCLDMKYVNMHIQGNYASLLPSEYVYIWIWRLKKTLYCSQGGELWHKLWKKAMLTGSSMYKALGLDTLKAEKLHVNVHVKGRPQPDVSAEVQKYLDFSNKNEINAMATLVSNYACFTAILQYPL